MCEAGGWGSFTSFTILIIIYSHFPGRKLWKTQICALLYFILIHPYVQLFLATCAFAVSQSFAQNIHAKSSRWAKVRAVLRPLCSRGVSSHIDMEESTRWKWRWNGRELFHWQMQWGCTCMRIAECQEVGRRVGGVTRGCGFTLGCRQLSLCPSTKVCAAIKEDNMCSEPSQQPTEVSLLI